ncbi:MAG: UDP-N-acetylmuramoyl-L-alanine--D-glutamate ligase [Colwellia sp.]|nr:UDP-N-acetylmuramoyl-L-alanine--D-glutamate ligase [Colwellia sp.]
MISLSQSTLLLLRDKKVLVLGIGLTGLSCAQFLSANNISFAINDSRENPFSKASRFSQNTLEHEIVLGKWDAELISQADIILVSPGIDLSEPEIKSFIKANCLVWGDIELYCRLTKTPILAVTGSNGKSTVVTLLAHLGKALGYKTELGGNVGVPVLDHLSEETDKGINTSSLEFLILELSSFQLENLSSMQAIAATVLNISDDHLDRHLTLENYCSIKQRIYQQSKIAIINRDDQATFLKVKNNNQSIVSFGSDEPKNGNFGLALIDGNTCLMFGDQSLIAIEDLPLAGMHNALNYLAALALGYCAGWSVVSMVNKLVGFEGLKHRCQKVSADNEIVWINDSKATNVGATLAAINGFAKIMKPSQQLILIAGGEGKGADFTPLKIAITEQVSQLITLGKDGGKIAKLSDNTIEVSTLKQAIEVANRLASPNDIVLLSPACASFDMFENFAERGQVFIDVVQKLKEVS